MRNPSNFVGHAAILLVASLGIWGPKALAQPVRKMVFAHYMVCCPFAGGTVTVGDFEREIRIAQAYGLDGFALNCGGWSKREPHYKARARMLYEAAARLGTGFKLFLSADFTTGLTFDETTDMVESFRDHPNQLKVDGKPVLSTYGGDQRNVLAFVRERFGDGVFFVPYHFPDPASEHPGGDEINAVFRRWQGSDGFFYFGAAGTVDQIRASNERIGRTWLANRKLYMASVTPYYRGSHPPNYRLFETNGFEAMASEWESAIALGAPWVEIVTWNDWQEASYVMPYVAMTGDPAAEPAYPQKVIPHDGYLAASRYYIDWFKKGKPPAIDDDRICYFYRLHPRTLGHAFPEGRAFPSGVGNLLEGIFATVFLTSPGRFEMLLGRQSAAWDLPAGVHHLRAPFFSPGVPCFRLLRDGKTILKHSGERAISDADDSSNFNYFSGAFPLPR